MKETRKQWTEKARAMQAVADADARAFLDQVKGQLLIVLVNRLGGSIALPVPEVDGTNAFNLAMRLTEQGEIYLETQRKQ